MNKSPESLTFNKDELKLLEKYLHYCLLFSIVTRSERDAIIDIWYKIAFYKED